MWEKTTEDSKHLYPVQFSTDGVLLITTTCCSEDQYMIIFRASDGSLLRALTYPNSNGKYDLSTRNMVLGGIDGSGFYNAYLNVKHANLQTTPRYFIGYYTFGIQFTIYTDTCD